MLDQEPGNLKDVDRLRSFHSVLNAHCSPVDFVEVNIQSAYTLWQGSLEYTLCLRRLIQRDYQYSIALLPPKIKTDGRQTMPDSQGRRRSCLMLQQLNLHGASFASHSPCPSSPCPSSPLCSRATGHFIRRLGGYFKSRSILAGGSFENT